MSETGEAGQPTLRASFDAVILSRLRSIRWGNILFKAIFFALAAAIAGIAQFVTWPEGASPTNAQVVGICATIGVFLAALVSIVSEKDATREIEIAQRLHAKAEEYRERYESTVRDWPDIERMIALHLVTVLFRDALEGACLAMSGDERTLISSMTTLAERSLPAAAGFSYADEWTICVYAAEPVEGDCRFQLRLVEHLRAIKCGKDTARVWPEGRGVAGIAFSNASEIVVADLTSETARAVFKPSGLEREYDDDRYRSMVAIPILVQGAERPWGIVTATSRANGHFNHEHEEGIKPIEAIRALADYAALAVAMIDSRDRAANSPPITKSP